MKQTHTHNIDSSDLSAGDIDKKPQFHEGWNTARVTHYQVAPSAMPGATLFQIHIANLFYNREVFIFMVPHDKECHPLLKDLHHFYKQEKKPWIEIDLIKSQGLQPGMEWIIRGMREIQRPTFEEMEQLSLVLRNPMSSPTHLI